MKEKVTLSELWKNDKYQSDILYLLNRTIVEYDMKSANTSLAREFNLLPEEKINEIEALGKQARVVAIGKIKQKDPTYNEKEKAAFMEARRLFFEINEIDDRDVIAIKRDAIFVSRYVADMKVGKYILFRPKNEYTSFVYLKPLELYYSNNGLDIKGISDEIYKTYHKEYFGDFLARAIRIIETCSSKEGLHYIQRFFDQYKWRKLEAGYYREFNNLSQFRYLNGECAMEEYMEDLSKVDISYNFNIIIQFLRTLM